MRLQFEGPPTYHREGHAIFLAGVDEHTGHRLTCVIHCDALEDAERVPAGHMGEAASLSAFDRHRTRIESILRTKYQRGEIEVSRTLAVRSHDLNA